MITITQHYSKFKVKFSNPGSGMRGYTVVANNLDEVYRAIEHYQGAPSFRGSPPFPSEKELKVDHHHDGHLGCPLCRRTRLRT
jgi:hypothetical protein